MSTRYVPPRAARLEDRRAGRGAHRLPARPGRQGAVQRGELGTPKRYLTGDDFDIESNQLIGDAFWFCDEFGPYLVRAERDGRVTGVFETRVDPTLLDDALARS